MMTFWTNKSLSVKIFFLSLVILNTFFLAYWLILAANYCLHYDDAHFMWKLSDISMFEYVREMYMTRGGNFFGYGLNAIMFSISNSIGAYRYWPILFYCIGIAMVYGAVKDLKLNIHKVDLLMGIIALYNIYILTSVDFAVFTWICAMGYYLYAPAICLILKYINTEALKWWQICLLFLLGLFIAGSSVSISTITFVVLFVNGMCLWYSESWNVKNTWHKPQMRRLIYLTLFMLVAFAIVVIAPGNYSRLESASDIEQPNSILVFFVACGKCMGMFAYLMSFYIFCHLLEFAIGYIAGTKSTIKLPMSRMRLVIIATVIYLVYLFVSVMPLAYLSNGFQIQRNYTQLSFFYMVCVFAIGYIIGCNKEEKRTKANWGAIICAVFLIVIVILNIHQDFPVAHAYRVAHEQREAYLEDLQSSGHKELVKVAPYPTTHTPDAKYNILKLFGKESNMQAIYYESDTDTEPNEYESHIRHLLNLDYDFVIEQNNENAEK